VVGEVGFADAVETGNGRHEIVIDPEASHGVVEGRVDTHRNLIRVLARDPLIHVEEIAIPLTDNVAAEAIDGVAEVEVDAEPGLSDTESRVTGLFRSPGRDVARGKVTEARILSLEIVVAFIFGNLVRRTGIAWLLRNPDPAVISQ
jgi:hypothetical protein